MTSGLQAVTAFAFSVQASDPDNDPLTHSWDFGDGTPAGSGTSPTHVYMSAGVFVVRVATSDGRLSATGQTSVTVKNLTGVWMKPWTVASCNAANRLSLTQSGDAVGGVYEAIRLSGDGSGVGLGTGPKGVNGTVRTSSPALRWTIDEQPSTRYDGNANSDVTSIEVTTCSFRPAPFNDEVCTRQTNFWDPLTRQ